MFLMFLVACTRDFLIPVPLTNTVTQTVTTTITVTPVDTAPEPDPTGSTGDTAATPLPPCDGPPLAMVEDNRPVEIEVGSAYDWGFSAIFQGPGRVCSQDCGSPTVWVELRGLYGGPALVLPHAVGQDQLVVPYAVAGNNAIPGEYTCILRISDEAEFPIPVTVFQ